MSENNNIEQQQQTLSFGKRFSTARGALDLSREEVAKKLRLSIEIIIALEDEDYELLTVPIYVTGYIRNYARLLNIPDEPLLAAYGQVQVKPPNFIADTVPRPGPSYSRWVIKLASIIIMLVLVAGIISWFQSQNFEPSSWFSSQEKELSQEPTLALPELIELDDTADTSILVQDSIESKSELEVPEKVIVTAKKIKPVVAPQVVAEMKNKFVEPAKNKIVLSFTNDSWVDLQDNTGKRLIYDLIRKGKEKRVNGQPPFKVFLGNAKGVKIEYNGQPVDVEQYRRGNLARFQIGNAAE